VSERRLALFVNPASAGGRAVAALPEIQAELSHLGVEHRVVDTRGVEHAREEARAAAESGETVVAVGGDGLVGCMAGALRGQIGPLAIVPSGRGNDFARVLKIPSQAREAARVAVDGSERVVDIGLANGRPFVGIASLGFD
jgi:diacylglycerol kinase family enzyme